MVDDTTVGYIGVSIAVLFFGSYAVPTKLVKTGDGVFFQWVSHGSQIQGGNNSDLSRKITVFAGKWLIIYITLNYIHRFSEFANDLFRSSALEFYWSDLSLNFGLAHSTFIL